MKLKIYFLCVFAILAVNSFSTIWHIKQDGTGDFITIQEGIDLDEEKSGIKALEKASSILIKDFEDNVIEKIF